MGLVKFTGLALVALLLSSCSLFGRTTVVHDRMAVITMPQPPTLQKATTAEEHQHNFQQVAEYAIRLTRGVHVYNEYAVKHNLEHGYFKAEEMEDIRQLYHLPPPKPESESEESPSR